ncbi:hypothetical protein PDE_09347 [Penicillium oxalicum 114-2]|uniref:Uncharacterized protein n=1 Tax=Penicillium oxalicum (strain 114-2 / CGMCC 5302) TaxID=933388 RepID=S8B678_PENO1|nr:hypothetical protein PDE_09347 [Penicillium oxalicum 114-2]
MTRADRGPQARHCSGPCTTTGGLHLALPVCSEVDSPVLTRDKVGHKEKTIPISDLRLSVSWSSRVSRVSSTEHTHYPIGLGNDMTRAVQVFQHYSQTIPRLTRATFVNILLLPFLLFFFLFFVFNCNSQVNKYC